MTVRARRALDRRWGFFAVTMAGIALAPSCKKTPTLDFSLSLPSDVASNVEWFDVGVFTGSNCAALGSQLAGGVPASGYIERIGFKKGDPTPPQLLNLPRAQYSIAVAARAADCSVLATGCDNVDLRSAKSVDVTLDDAAKPVQGACTDGAVCNDARCAPGTDNGDPSVGAGCSLELIGAGPLADPLLPGGGSIVTAPAIAATDRGFLIAYREDDQPDGIARLTIVPVDSGGSALTPQQTQQPACSDSELSDALGAVFTGKGGVVAAARPGCGANGGIDLYDVNDTGVFGSTAFTSEGANRVTFSTAHSLTQAGAGTYVAYVQSDTATVAPLNGVAVGTATTFGDGARASDAWIALSEGAMGLVAAGTADTSAAIPEDAEGGADAGGEGGSAGGVDASLPPADDAGTISTNGVLRVNVVAASSSSVSLGTLPPSTTFPGNWAGVSALAGRVYVVSDGQTTAQPIAFRAFDVGTAAPVVTSGFTVTDPGPVLYSDVAFHQDHVFFAVESPAAIALVAYDHATTTPTLLRTVELASDARVPSIATVRDGRVAVLATDSRVMVAWTTEESLTFNDPTGGYALFACTTP